MAKPMTYLTALWRQENILANWHPDKTLTPGNIVSRDGNGTVHVETTIETVARRARETLPPMNLITRDASPVQSHKNATFAAEAHAAATTAALEVSFSKTGGYTLKADGGTISEFETLAPWRTLLTRLQAQGIWEENWQLVTHVRDYQRITLVRANRGGQKVSLNASIPIGPVPGLGDIVAGASATSSSSGFSAWGRDTAATLGFEGLQVTMRFVRPNVVETAELRHASGRLTRQPIVETVSPDWDLDVEE